MHIVEPELPVDFFDVRILQVHFAFAAGAKLRADKCNAGFELFDDEIIVMGFAIGRNYLDAITGMFF